MKKTNSNILLTALGLIFSSANSFATECTPAPDCASLGYSKTATDCEGLVSIKCPFDTSKMACFAAEECKVEQNVSVGAILYGDGTVSSELISGKQPIGVVFDIFNRLAIALTDVKQDGSAGSEKMYWSSADCDTPGLENCGYDSPTTCGTDGRANTNAILATNGGCGGTTYAANAVNAYQTSNCRADFCQKGKWFLPSLRDLNTIYTFKSVIQNSLTLLVSIGAQQLQDGSLENYYWSSTEYNEGSVFYVGMTNGWGTYDKKYRYTMYYVRPVVKF